MKIHKDVLQGSPEWYRLHFGRVTASELGNLMTPNFQIRKGEMPYTYLCKKVAESWRGIPLPGFTSHETDYGIEMEMEARGWAGMQEKEGIKMVGFVESDCGWAGCSPDGLIGEDGGIEIKCPEAHTHVKYLLKGTVPDEYITQVHHSLYVTGRKWWRFVSYRRKFPPIVITVHRNEAVCDAIAGAVGAFTSRFCEAMNAVKSASQQEEI